MKLTRLQSTNFKPKRRSTMFSELPDDEENQNDCKILKQENVTQF